MKSLMLTPYLSLFVVGCSNNNEDLVFLNESSGVFIASDSGRSWKHVEEYSTSKKCESNEVLVDGKCQVAIRTGDLVGDGWIIAANPVESEPGYVELTVYAPKLTAE